MLLNYHALELYVFEYHHGLKIIMSEHIQIAMYIILILIKLS